LKWYVNLNMHSLYIFHLGIVPAEKMQTGKIISKEKKMRSVVIVAVIALVIGLAGSSFAGFVGPSAEAGKGNVTVVSTTVKAILDKPVDDMHVIINGNILKKLSHKKYIFSDRTGEITIEIDEDVFPQAQITPLTKVEILGEVERKFFKPVTIDVKSIKILQ
jgi:uncharacterized protein (TIGR00156 family)